MFSFDADAGRIMNSQSFKMLQKNNVMNSIYWFITLDWFIKCRIKEHTIMNVTVGQIAKNLVNLGLVDLDWTWRSSWEQSWVVLLVWLEYSLLDRSDGVLCVCGLVVMAIDWNPWARRFNSYSGLFFVMFLYSFFFTMLWIIICWSRFREFYSIVGRLWFIDLLCFECRFPSFFLLRKKCVSPENSIQ